AGAGYPDPSNAEIVTVTARSSDTLTIVRAQEGTSARTIVVGDVIIASVTKSVLEELAVSSGGRVSRELLYEEKLTDTGVTSNNSASPTVIFSGTPLTFDGVTRVKAEFFASGLNRTSDFIVALYIDGAF